jgi:hypothetical protein
LASSIFALPVKRRALTRPFALFACLCASSANWILLIPGTGLILAADLFSGPLISKKKPSVFRRKLKGTFFSAAVGWRAVRLRILYPYFVALCILGATHLFLSNNNPAPSLAEKVIRLGGALSLIFLTSHLSHMLSSRRPPWPWARSLPWSVAHRILSDAAFLCFFSIPLVVLIAVLSITSMLLLAASLPLLCLFSTLCIRHALDKRLGASAPIFLYGTLGALALCLFHWLFLFYLAVTPLVLKGATKADQRQKVSRWFELHHLAAGDSLSWSE